MQITFLDTKESWSRMLPLAYTRPVADLRVGILKVSEKWSSHLSATSVSFRTEEYLQTKFPAPTSRALTIKGGVLPTAQLVELVSNLKDNEVVMSDDNLIAGYFGEDEPFETGNRNIVKTSDFDAIQYPWDIFRINGQEIKNDFELITTARSSQPISDAHTITYGAADQIFVEAGASIKAAILNAENGPIYIGKDAEVGEGTIIRGPFALCEKSTINMGAKMRGDSTIGPFSKVGGEISNSVIQGYSSKGHEGFLGNSVLGEWCNLGADTNNSNLKNNYSNVKMWDFDSDRFKDTGLQFCGLIMGDHSKCGINTMFNRGTTIGVSANIFGDGFPRNFIPSYAWGGASGFSTYKTNKVFETAELVVSRRGKELTEEDKDLLSHVFEITSHYRVWEKK